MSLVVKAVTRLKDYISDLIQLTKSKNLLKDILEVMGFFKIKHRFCYASGVGLVIRLN